MDRDQSDAGVGGSGQGSNSISFYKETIDAMVKEAMTPFINQLRNFNSNPVQTHVSSPFASLGSLGSDISRFTSTLMPPPPPPSTFGNSFIGGQSNPFGSFNSSTFGGSFGPTGSINQQPNPFSTFGGGQSSQFGRTNGSTIPFGQFGQTTPTPPLFPNANFSFSTTPFAPLAPPVAPQSVQPYRHQAIGGNSISSVIKKDEMSVNPGFIKTQRSYQMYKDGQITKVDYEINAAIEKQTTGNEYVIAVAGSIRTNDTENIKKCHSDILDGIIKNDLLPMFCKRSPPEGTYTVLWNADDVSPIFIGDNTFTSTIKTSVKYIGH